MKRLLAVLASVLVLASCTTVNVNPGADGQASASAQQAAQQASQEEDDDPFKPWDETLKDTREIEGYFTFHQKPDRTLLLEIAPEQLGTDFGLMMHYSQGVGDFNVQDGLYLSGTRLMRLKRVGNKIHLVHRNSRFKADEGSALRSAMKDNVGHSIVGAFEITSKNEDTGALLVDVTDFFASDYARVSDRLKPYFGNKPVGFKKERSYVAEVKGFPENVEVDALLTYAPSESPSFGGAGVSDPRSVPVGVRYSLFKLPEDPMQPRPADDRVGYFTTAQFDFSEDRKPSAYDIYANRWRLEKEDAGAARSEPVEPIVYYIDRSVPEEYREYVRQGIEGWNKAFHAAGFEDAVVAKVAPDDSSWSAQDVRYSTISWTPSYNMGYAIGPSQVDPRTGEILNADILISALWPRFWLGDWDVLASPGEMIERDEKLRRMRQRLPSKLADRLCTAASSRARQLALQRTMLVGRGTVDPTEPMPEEYLGAAIRDLVMHEVGHTLGLRHNFRASSSIPFERLQDEAYTREHGVTLSVMDYGPVNLAREASEQGHYWNPEVGSYDEWAIRYGYAPIEPSGEAPDSFARRADALDEIARQSADPMHAYGTDEDALFGPFSVDPRSTRDDLGADPFRWAESRAALVSELQPHLSERLIGDGMRWHRLRGAFSSLIFERYNALQPALKMVGGVHVVRDHKGDPNARQPLTPVPAERQRAATALLVEEAFAPNAFQFDPTLLNRLAPDRHSHWGSGGWTMQIDFPIHEYVASVQGGLLQSLLHPARLARMIDNTARMPDGAAPYRPGELFHALTGAIWSELEGGQNINSFRRNLQRIYTERLTTLLLQDQMGGTSVPEDARSLSRLELRQLSERIGAALAPGASLDRSTRAHLLESKARIDRALDASLSATVEE